VSSNPGVMSRWLMMVAGGTFVSLKRDVRPVL